MSLDVADSRCALTNDAGASSLAACVRTVRDALDESGLLAQTPRPKPGKRADLSAKMRVEGNDRYAKKRFADALEAYTGAVAVAPPNSEQLALAYGNRSATLFELGERDDCLADVDRALAIGGTAAFVAKLERRRVACSTLVGRERDADIELDRARLFPPPPRRIERVPCASAALEIRETATSGRGVFAVEALRPGDVLAVERPFATLLVPEHVLRRCGACLKRQLAPIACERCRFALYCNEQCREDARRIHEFECPIADWFFTTSLSKIELMSLRTVLTAYARFGSWERLRDEAERVDAEPKGIDRGHVIIDGEPVYDSEHYAAIHAFETNVEKRDERELRQRAKHVVVIVHLLRHYTRLFDATTPEETDTAMQFAGGLLLHHNLTAASNMHNIEALVEDSNGKFLKSEQYGSGAYAFHSLINHSCAPNVVRACIGNSIVLLALRPINPGDEILDNYGEHHALQSLHERQENLLTQYKFECKCIACIENWPQYFSLQAACLSQEKKQKFNNLIDMKVIEELERGNKAFALSIINKLYKNVELLEDYAPCKELADHQETIKQCWALFENIEYFPSKK